MTKHMTEAAKTVKAPKTKKPAQFDTTAEWDWQRDMPEKLAMNLDYATGFALGVAYSRGEHMAHASVIGDGRVLSWRYRSVETAAHRMRITAKGLHGLLAGADCHPGTFEGPSPIETIEPPVAEGTEVAPAELAAPTPVGETEVAPDQS